MPIETRIFRNLRKSVVLLKKRFDFFKKNFTISVLFLFIGFFLGNIFGTFLNWLRHFIIWDGLLVFTLLLFFEIISSVVYQKNSTFLSPPVSTNKRFRTSFFDFLTKENIFYKIRLFPERSKQVTILKNSTKSTDQLDFKINQKRLRYFLTINTYFLKSLPIWRLLNCLKVGILFGFFIDAFKVGS